MTPHDDIIGGETTERKFYGYVMGIICTINMILGLFISLGMDRWMRGIVGYIILMLNLIGIAIANKV